MPKIFALRSQLLQAHQELSSSEGDLGGGSIGGKGQPAKIPDRWDVFSSAPSTCLPHSKCFPVVTAEAVENDDSDVCNAEHVQEEGRHDIPEGKSDVLSRNLAEERNSEADEQEEEKEEQQQSAEGKEMLRICTKRLEGHSLGKESFL